MKLQMLLAEYITPHPDGTFSLLRGGVDKVSLQPHQPPLWRGGLLVRLQGLPLEGPLPELKVHLVNERGETIHPTFNIQPDLRERTSSVNLIVNFQILLPGPGKYWFKADFASLHDEIPLEMVDPNSKPEVTS